MTARTGDVPAAEFNASQAAINELMELVAKQDVELAALKGRRCDGCAHYEADAGCHRLVALVRADFACNYWEAQP